MSSKILRLLEGFGDDAQVGAILRKAVAQAQTALASKDHAHAVDLIAFCSENLQSNPHLLQTEEVEDIVQRLCFPVAAARMMGGKEEETQGREILQRVCEFLAGTMSSSFRKHHPKPCEIVMKACTQSLLTYSLQKNLIEAMKPKICGGVKLFWKLIQQGLIHTNPLTRKRCSYLMKRAVDVAATSGRSIGQGSHGLDEQPLFSWNPAEKEKLLRLWFEFFLIYETLEEVQIHVVTPAMPRLAQLTKATYRLDGAGIPIMHSSWLCILYQRCFVHESKTITRLGVTQCLNLDLDKSSFLHQSGPRFIFGPLLTALHEEYLYTKPPETPPGSQPPIGLALKKFMVFCVSQLNDDTRKTFLSDLLALICEQAWGPVTISFVAEALASIPAFPAWGRSSLFLLRDKLSSGFVTCPPGYRSTIQCFFLRAALHLLDWSSISLHQLSSLLGVCNAAEVLKRGSSLWEEVCQAFHDNMLNPTSSDPDIQPRSPWQTCIQEIKGYLHVDPTKEALERDDLPNREEAQRVVITMLMVADSQALDHPQDSHISDLLQPLHEVLGRAGSHVYLPTQKADKALQILYALLQESQTSSQDQRYSEFCTSLTILLCETLGEIFQYLNRQLLGNRDVQVHDVNSITLYRSFLDALLSHAGRENEGQGRSSQGQGLTLKIIEGRKQLLKGCEALMNSQLQNEHYVKEMHHCYTMMSILTWILSSEAFSPGAMLPSTSNMLTSLLRVEASASARLKEVAEAGDMRGLDGSNRGRLQSDVIRTKWEAILAVIQHWDRHRGKAGSGLTQEDDPVAWQPVLSACLSDMSLVSALHTRPLLKCTALLIDKVADENIPLCLEGLSACWCAVLDGWRANSTFWNLFEAFIAVAYQSTLLQHGEGTEVYEAIEKYTAKILSQGETRLGMLNTLMCHLDKVLSEHFFLPPPEKHHHDAMTVIRNLSGILQEAALFGPCVSKSVRLMEDISAYLVRHEELLTVRPILQNNSNVTNPCHPRVLVISILMKIGASNFQGKEEFFEDFLSSLLDKDQEIIPKKRSYIINSVVHRLKLRIWQAAIIILNFLSPDAAPRILARVLRSMRAENQTSVRHLMEVFVVRMIHLHPHLLQQFWQYASEVANCQDVSFSPLLMIIAHLGTVQPKDQQESFYLQAIPTVLPWTFVPSMALRVQSQVALFKMWKDCKEAGLTTLMDRFPGVAVCMDFTQNNSALHSLRERMEGSFFLSYFHPIQHFSVETIFYIMPKLTLVTEDELVHPELFLVSDTSPWKQNSNHPIVPLYSETDTLRTCTVKEKQKNKSVKDAEIREVLWTDDGSGDIQKKITPWKESHIPGFESSEGQKSPRGHLVVVASLISRVPNLGGLCRTCEIFGASCLVLGNLALKDHQDFLSLSVSAERWLPLREVKPSDLKDYMIEMKKHGYTLVGVEQTANSQSLTDFKFPQRTMLLLGKEREGIPVELIQFLDVCVEIPQLGFIRSLNVHVSGALMIWEYTRQKLLGLKN
eukprot:XP_011682785.1 PREDICTED: probable methyltransferase TARBP1 [Strongylocentrotus purpuratus]